ncbi:Melanopsin [Acropora cervicornis]|uniref:Melanopsin n=1 Tax=Acropora cervicornis TaxID=6130 RepID=A0AAD9R5D5_ACRCE|nr:Melanopsin [Acropora cervicornis]
MNNSYEEQEMISSICGFINVEIHFDQQDALHSIFLCTINVLFAVSAIFLNCTVIFIIWKTRSLRTPSNIFVVGLAVSDLAVGLIVQPLFVATIMTGIRGEFSTYCSLRLTMQTVALIVLGASFFTLTIISVERLLALSLHLRYQAAMTCKRAVVCVGSIWLLTLVWALCRFWIKMQVFTAVNSLLVYTSLLINTLAYIQIFRLVKRHKTQIASQAVNCARTTCSTRLQLSKYVKTVSTIVTLLIVTIATYSGWVVVTIALRLSVGGKNEHHLYAAFTSVTTLVFVTSTFNPVLYCLRLGEIRAAKRMNSYCLSSQVMNSNVNT